MLRIRRPKIIADSEIHKQLLGIPKREDLGRSKLQKPGLPGIPGIFHVSAGQRSESMDIKRLPVHLLGIEKVINPSDPQRKPEILRANWQVVPGHERKPIAMMDHVVRSEMPVIDPANGSVEIS